MIRLRLFSSSPFVVSSFTRTFGTTSNVVKVSLSQRGSQQSQVKITPVLEPAKEFVISNRDYIPLIQETLPHKAGASVYLLYPNENAPSQELLIRTAKKWDFSAIRSVIYQSITTLRARNIQQAYIHLEDIQMENATQSEIIDHITRTAILTGYEFSRYKKPDPTKKLFKHLEICVDKPEILDPVVNTSSICAEGVLIARDLSNEQADVANPDYLEHVANNIAKENPRFRFSVIKGSELESFGLNLLRAVGQAASQEPRLLVLEYNPSDEEPIAIVGKGITYDTGGLNLKPTGFMETMHMDMSGAAAVLGTAAVISKLAIDKRVLFVIPVAENAIGERSYKPGSIVKSFSGQTVEVGNTDAEGRLILADALSYIQRHYKPKTIIDLATLTGACVVALGEYAAGLFSNSQELSAKIQRDASLVQERCWPMPIFPEHSKELESTFADIKSIGEGRYGGACTAAAFLQKFIDEGVDWAHIDIAGPAMYSKQREYMSKGGTGFGVQTLLQYLAKE